MRGFVIELLLNRSRHLWRILGLRPPVIDQIIEPSRALTEGAVKQ
jgi:hypothetical protein